MLHSAILSALRKLSKHSGLYPDCLLLQGIKPHGSDPVEAGRFGDVWKGELNGRPVAVKIIRTYLKSDVAQLARASFLSAESLGSSQQAYPLMMT